ncbi:short-chain dehydrogenase/reductase SDR [Meredithblackwellia eburnea MCA 4105]
MTVPLVTTTTTTNGHHSPVDPSVAPVQGKLAGKTALITGGCLGFGAAMVQRFKFEGANVVVLDLDTSRGKEEGVVYVQGDVSKEESWVKALQVSKDKFGAVQVLVNNAGISRNAKAHELPESQYDLLISIHLKALYHSVKIIFPHFLENGDGRVINIGSTGATRPRPGFTWYNMTKGAILTATKSLAIEYAPTIRVNGIIPAIGNTNMLLESFGGKKPEASQMGWVMDMIPMKRITEPSDIANAALFLVSDEASFVTGTLMDVDGGRGI